MKGPAGSQGHEQQVAARTASSEAEMAERQQAEARLRDSERRYRDLNAMLEQRVAERTAEVEAASALLREREERLQLILEGSRLGTWNWDIASDVVSRNDYWAAMLGYTLVEIDDTTADGWLELLHPDDRARAWQSIDDHLAGRTPFYEVEYRMRARDGGYRWILDRARIVSRDGEGRPLRMSGTHEDITARKQIELRLRQNEEHFRLAFENANTGMCLVDLQGRLLQVNDKMSAIFGYSRQELEGMTINDLTHPDDLTMSLETRTHPASPQRSRSREITGHVPRNTHQRQVSERTSRTEGQLAPQ
ncbi:MAG: PAS domain S-box protein [Chromatiaceae bacterium]